MKSVLAVLPLFACLSVSRVGAQSAFLQEAQSTSPRPAKQQSTAPPRFQELDWDTYVDKVQGAWMGKMIGVTFGQPWEFEYLGTPIGFDITDWTISPTRMKADRARSKNRTDYEEPITNEVDNQKVHMNRQFVETSEKEYPSFGSPDNDDIYINLLFLYCLRRYGIDVEPVTVAHEWDAKIRQVWHANDAGLANIRKGILPPQSGSPRYLHADDIDFQIESDVFGMIAPGMPQVSNRFDDRMGHIMNYGDGVYGGMFISAMYTQAFFAKNIREVVENGLKAIPPQSLYAKLIRDVIQWHDENPNDWLKTWHLLQAKWGEVDHCPDGYKQPFNIDAKLNGGYVVIGLLYGNGDWYKTMNYATRCGQDADCNPANAAGILGTLIGARAIPAEYREPLHNTYWNKSLAGLPNSFEIGVLSVDTAEIGLKVLLANGGQVRSRNGKLILRIPYQEPVAPAKLEQIHWKEDQPVPDNTN